MVYRVEIRQSSYSDHGPSRLGWPSNDPRKIPFFQGWDSHCFLPDFTGFGSVTLGSTGFLPSFTGFYLFLPGLTGFYLVLPSFTVFYWVLRGFT